MANFQQSHAQFYCVGTAVCNVDTGSCKLTTAYYSFQHDLKFLPSADIGPFHNRGALAKNTSLKDCCYFYISMIFFSPSNFSDDIMAICRSAFQAFNYKL